RDVLVRAAAAVVDGELVREQTAEPAQFPAGDRRDFRRDQEDARAVLRVPDPDDPEAVERGDRTECLAVDGGPGGHGDERRVRAGRVGEEAIDSCATAADGV